MPKIISPFRIAPITAKERVEHFQAIVDELAAHEKAVPATLQFYRERLAEAQRLLERERGDA